MLSPPAAFGLASVPGLGRLHRWITSLLQIVVPALILSFLFRSLVFAGFYIPSSSMEPTLQIGDRLFVNRFLYGAEIPFSGGVRLPALRPPERGDVVVFRYPGDPSQDFIKRVVGVEGDVLSMRNKRLYRNGERVEEDWARYLESGVRRPGRDDWGPVTVPTGKLFVMGDNRDRSADSRSWGFVDRTLLKGKAEIIYWSWDADSWRPRWARLLHTIP